MLRVVKSQTSNKYDDRVLKHYLIYEKELQPSNSLDEFLYGEAKSKIKLIGGYSMLEEAENAIKEITDKLKNKVPTNKEYIVYDPENEAIIDYWFLGKYISK